MNVVILAAGQGKRLGILTEDKPKCLLEFGDETILERQLNILYELGFSKENIFLVVGFMADKVSALYESHTTIVLNNNYYNTDNSYSLGIALKYIVDHNFKDETIVLDGDLVFEKELFIEILKSKSKNAIFAKNNEGSYDSTGVEINENNRVLEIGKHVKNSGTVYLSIMRLSTECLDELSSLLMQAGNRRYWYSVVLNNYIKEIPFVCEFLTSDICEINSYYDLINAKNQFNIKSFKILLTGASGFLGKKLYSILSRDYEIVGVQNKSKFKEFYNLELGNRDALEAFLCLNKPDIIIHTAAIADPDICENNKKKAHHINVEITKLLCEVCKQRNIKLIFISTDYVFDGESKDAYYVDSECSPINYYGYTKQLAENLVRTLAEYLIIRIPIIYGFNDENDKETFFTKTINLLNTKKHMYLDNLQVRYPVLTDEVALGIKKVLSHKGTIHFTSDMGVTKYEWALAIAETFNYDKNLIHEGNNIDIKNRPLNVKLDNTHLKERGIYFSNIKQGMEIVKKQMHCVFKLIYKSNPIEEYFNINIGEFRFNLGKMLGQEVNKEILESLDYIVPIPSSGLYYAMGMSQATGIPYLQGLVKTDTEARSFNIMDLGLREKVIKTKILPIRNLLKNKTIALVDEAIFTGTTLRVTCDILKACEVRQIHICIPTPISFSRCKQYVQPNRVLLSENINSEILKDYFMVDSVKFICYDKFVCYLYENSKYMCYECFDSNYKRGI